MGFIKKKYPNVLIFFFVYQNRMRLKNIEIQNLEHGFAHFYIIWQFDFKIWLFLSDKNIFRYNNKYYEPNQLFPTTFLNLKEWLQYFQHKLNFVFKTYIQKTQCACNRDVQLIIGCHVIRITHSWFHFKKISILRSFINFNFNFILFYLFSFIFISRLWVFIYFIRI